MQKVISFFKYSIILLGLLVNLNCSDSTGVDKSEEFIFAVLNVGQGLSQIAIRDSEAVVLDMGDIDEFSLWQDGYSKLGSPFIKAIIISHGDMDHKGGLHLLPSGTAFSGLVITSPFEDTAALRVFANEWSSSIYFRTVKQYDTLAIIDNVYIECIWPPYNIDSAQWIGDTYNKNQLSLCFKMQHANSSVLITGDIDSIVADILAKTYTFNLNSDIFVVPHHGSRGSLHSVFYGYINPDYAVISCGTSNPYGHPSEDIIRLLAFQMMVTVFDTRYDGHVVGINNGEYWVWENKKSSIQ